MENTTNIITKDTIPAFKNWLISAAAEKGKNCLALLFETIGATGIRVSEVKYITVEAARAGKAQISLKGKIRTILLPQANLGGDESGLQGGWGVGDQGLPAQPAAPVCAYIL